MAQQAGARPEMYAPVLAFAHLFAAFWLLRMLFIMYKPGSKKAGRPGKAAPKAIVDATLASKDPEAPPALLADSSDISLAPDQRPPPSVTPAATSATAPVGAGALKRLATSARAAGAPPAAEALDGSSSDYDTSSSTPHGGGGAVAPSLPVVPSKDSQIILRRLTTNLRPMVLEWSDLGCAYPTGDGIRTVLQHVYGHADPGQMLALMGPSGAGKSTLMDILSARKTVGRLTGQVLVNSRPRSADFTRKTAYVPQYDNFLPTMTVAETAGFYASLLLPRNWGAGPRRERVAQVLAAMGLGHTADTLVGGTLPGGIMLRGLSGGERKRLSIATGIISTPAIIFLDEPTSGLDSFSALSVMGYMQCMAHRGGHTVVASIHQPRAAIWAMFDTALVLSSGMLMYFGPRDGLVPWFGSLGYAYDAAMHGVPSDWVMDLVNVGFLKPQKFYGKMINTKDELAEASAAFLKDYLATEGGAGAEEGRAGGGLSGPAGLAAPAAPAAPRAAGGSGSGRSADAGALVADGDAAEGGDGNLQDPEAPRAAASAEPPKRFTRFYTGKGSFSPRASTAGAAGSSGGSGHVSFEDQAAGAALAPAPAPAAAPMPAHKAAELQAVLDAHAASVQQHGAAAPRGRGGLAALMPGARRAGGGVDGEDWLASPPVSPKAGFLGKRSGSQAGWFRQFRTLLWRELLSVTRNPADVAGRMLIFTWISVLIGLIYYNLDDSIGALRSRLNVLFVQPVIFLLLPYVYMSLYSADKQYYLADATSKLYRPSAFYAAKQVAILPFAVLNVLSFSLILYGMAGLRMEAVAVIANCAFSVLLYLIAAQVLACSAVICPNQDIAFMVAIAWTAINMLMSNFMVRFADMSQVWLSELRYISAMAYAFEGYATAEFKGGSYSCANGLPTDVIGYLPSFLPNTTALQSPLVVSSLQDPGPGCVINLGSILDYFNLYKPLWLTVVILAGYLLVVHVLTYGAYLLVARKERR